MIVIVAVAWFWPFSSAPPSETIDSIAVLPIENRTNDPELNFLAEGITQGAIHRLSQVEQLKRVVPGIAMERYTQQGVDLGMVGEDLGVQGIVTGYLRQTGEEIALYVELVDARNNRSLWGDGLYAPVLIFWKSKSSLRPSLRTFWDCSLRDSRRMNSPSATRKMSRRINSI